MPWRRLYMWYKILLIYINFSFNFLSQNHLISLGFSLNMDVFYMHSDHMLFTTFASVLYQIYNHSPSARFCISDTTRPLMLYILLTAEIAWSPAVFYHKHVRISTVSLSSPFWTTSVLILAIYFNEIKRKSNLNTHHKELDQLKTNFKILITLKKRNGRIFLLNYKLSGIVSRNV